MYARYGQVSDASTETQISLRGPNVSFRSEPRRVMVSRTTGLTGTAAWRRPMGRASAKFLGEPSLTVGPVVAYLSVAPSAVKACVDATSARIVTPVAGYAGLGIGRCP